ncbi:MAG: thioredoxin domain-containing protein [Acidimicrobiales bacterium]
MTNRLAGETSPYLRQHADNPVEWYPWGDEAFAAAAERDCPVLLSVGYSACHWCHVMAHESFEDPATAALLNERFVAVKVDREERPDVDTIYMEAVQAMTGTGGWPMTVFLTPDGQPFYGGTYFPREEGRGMPTFTSILKAVDEAWRERREQVLEGAGQLVREVQARTRLPLGSVAAGAEAVLAEAGESGGAAGGGAREGGGAGQGGGSAPGPAVSVGPGEGAEMLVGGLPATEVLHRALAAIRSAHDDRRGGFGRAPKFPQPSMIEVLLETCANGGTSALAGGCLSMAATTLDAMASGGIYDHLGGGFHRYSVDATWSVPHFEKMLYDQAGLAKAYLHAWQLTGEQRWKQVVEETIGYVLGTLRGPDGGLCSAEDADSEGAEGRFYVWTPDQMYEVLGDSAPDVWEWYGVSPQGNFEGNATVLFRSVRGRIERPAGIEKARKALLEARNKRPRPGLDDKVLTEWNAMFVATLAEAAAAMERPDWRAAAVGIAAFLLASLRRAGDGRWLRSWQDGGARHLAYAADYAWLIEAFTRLGELTGEARWTAQAREAADAMLGLFWDDEDGGLFSTGADAERLIVRSKDIHDGATPSANAVAAVALARLGALTGEERFTEAARAIIDVVGPILAGAPSTLSHCLAAVDLCSAGVTEVAVVGECPDMVRAIQDRYLPRVALAWGEPYPSPLWEGRSPGFGYVCRAYTCGSPASSVEELVTQL